MEELAELLSIDFIKGDNLILERSAYQTELTDVELHICEYQPDHIAGIEQLNPDQAPFEELIGEALSERGTLFLAEFNLPTIVERFNLASMSGSRSAALRRGQKLASQIAHGQRLQGPMVIRQVVIDGQQFIDDQYCFSGYGRLQDIGEVAILAQASDPAAFWMVINLLFGDIRLNSSD